MDQICDNWDKRQCIFRVLSHLIKEKSLLTICSEVFLKIRTCSHHAAGPEFFSSLAMQEP